MIKSFIIITILSYRVVGDRLYTYVTLKIIKNILNSRIENSKVALTAFSCSFPINFSKLL